jgi:F-type H+-transporting ATPase subunit alpha
MQNNYFDDIDVSKMVSASDSLRDFLVSRKEALLTSIREKAKIDDDLSSQLKTAVDEWKNSFA